MPEKGPPKKTVPHGAEAQEGESHQAALKRAMQRRGLATRLETSALAAFPQYPKIAESAKALGGMIAVYDDKGEVKRDFDVRRLPALREAAGEDRLQQFEGAVSAAALVAEEMIESITSRGIEQTINGNIDWSSEPREVPIQQFLTRLYDAFAKVYFDWQREVFPANKGNVSIIGYEEIESRRESELLALMAAFEALKAADPSGGQKPPKQPSPISIVEDEVRALDTALQRGLHSDEPAPLLANKLLKLMGTALLLGSEYGAGYQNARIIRRLYTPSYRWGTEEKGVLILDAIEIPLGTISYAKQIAARYSMQQSS